MNDIIITGPGDYLTRNGRMATIGEPIWSGAARGILDDAPVSNRVPRVYVWNAAGICLSGEHELDIIIEFCISNKTPLTVEKAVQKPG
jgi:hypothetical protein